MASLVLSGQCHCGNLRAELTTLLSPAQLALRACQCSFCRGHRSRTASDPAGQLGFSARDPASVSRYQFGSRTAQMLVCRACGGYLGAFMPEDGDASRGFGIANVNHFARAAEFTQEPARVDYDGETLEARRARRRKLWTPATFPAGGD
ncbi:MAG: hypothetical protein NVSMB23_10470 [Myxococcales bacterium]